MALCTQGERSEGASFSPSISKWVFMLKERIRQEQDKCLTFHHQMALCTRGEKRPPYLLQVFFTRFSLTSQPNLFITITLITHNCDTLSVRLFLFFDDQYTCNLSGARSHVQVIRAQPVFSGFLLLNNFVASFHR